MKLIDYFQTYTLTNHQQELIQNLEQFLDTSNSSSNVFLLKGYAGTGKTFITKGLTEYFSSIGRRYILAAPTGKAAKVIQEKTGSEAHTIHKTIYGDKVVKESETSLVEYKNDDDDRTYKFYFDLRPNEDSADTVYIIDEASMISDIYSEMEFIRFGSGYLLQDLMRYINLDQNDHNKKIIFIGDNAQLPPVGMNFSPVLSKSYLLDTFGLSVDEYELKEVVRQKSDSGVLVNANKLREALETKVFNQLNIDATSPDIHDINHGEFINTYLEINNHRISKDSMVISYTNASVTEYNQQIRKHFFKDTTQIQENDKIMVLANNSNYDIFLSNGDFGLVTKILGHTEHKQIKLKRKNKETEKVEQIAIDLYFRDVQILFKDINNIPHLITCKIIENLLFSEKANLNSDESKAIYLDFVMRNSHLKPNTKEFTDAIRNDAYFNALKVKFGYAITCHKAQGSEWKNVFLNCKSHQTYLSEEYFRWLYTALTRTSESIYVLNAPHVGLFDSMKKQNIYMEHIVNQENNPVADIIKNSTDNQFNIQDPFLLLIYQKVFSAVHSHSIEIINLVHQQWQEQYTFKNQNESVTATLYYNKKQIITNIQMLETNNLSNQLQGILEPIKNHVIDLVEQEDNEFSFAESFMENFYMELKYKVKNIDVEIKYIEHLPWMERYTFVRKSEIAIIDFYYNKKGQFTSTTPSKKSNSAVLIQDIIGAL